MMTKVRKCECGLLIYLRKMPCGPRWVHQGCHKQMHDRIMLARAQKAEQSAALARPMI
jgi:hypothetical protein